eukprot:6016896-Amphidinium_carterae.1
MVGSVGRTSNMRWAKQSVWKQTRCARAKTCLTQHPSRCNVLRPRHRSSEDKQIRFNQALAYAKVYYRYQHAGVQKAEPGGRQARTVGQGINHGGSHAENAALPPVRVPKPCKNNPIFLFFFFF